MTNTEPHLTERPGNSSDIGRQVTYRVTARWITFTVLTVVVVATCLLSLTGLKISYGPHENRKLAEVPPVTLPGLMDRMHFRKIGDWANDHQALRSPLIAIQSWIRLGFFEAAIGTDTVIGTNGYYYYGHAKMLRDFTRQDQFGDDPGYVRGVFAYFKSLDAWATATDRIVLILVTPNKHNVYPEFFSARYRFGEAPSTAERIDAWLQTNLPHMAIPITEKLIEAKQKGAQVFYRTDTHWTPNGSKLGTDAILKRVKALKPDIHFPPQPKYTIRKQVRKNGNFARLLGLPLIERLPVVVLEGPRLVRRDKKFAHQLIPEHLPKTTRVLHRYLAKKSDERAPRLLVIGDSFMFHMIHFLANSVGYSVFYNSWGYAPDPTVRFPKKLMEVVDPKIVVFQLVERRISPCKKDNPPKTYRTCGQGSFLPLLPPFAATPRLTNLFDAPSARTVASSVQLSGPEQRIDIKLDKPLQSGQLAVAKLVFKGIEPLKLTATGNLASQIEYELTYAKLGPGQRTAYVVLNVEKGQSNAGLSVSRALSPDEVAIEVHYAPDDVDMTIPQTNVMIRAKTDRSMN